MSNKAAINSKGRITLPVGIRRDMRLREGDILEFIMEAGVTTMRRLVADSNPFTKWAGRLGGQQRSEGAVQWQRELRDER